MFRFRMLLLKIIPIVAIANASAQVEPDMVTLPAACVEVGTLIMDWQATPLREVCIDSFAIGRYEVTFAEYDLFTEATNRAARNDVGFGRENRPVIDVSLFDAMDYAKWLSEQTGKSYRLPTGAEWEYAARAGVDIGFKYSWGSDLIENRANCRNCGSKWDGRMTAPAGSFEPNPFGLYDMQGNVSEWALDCANADDSTEVKKTHCVEHTVRGGSWAVDASELFFWIRAPQAPENSSSDTGFRLVLEQES